jgi:phospholipid/cholesterol/gamma-HCH transport system substrate-binding protein
MRIAARTNRWVAVAVVAVGVVVIALLLLRGGGYTVRAHFTNASGLVKGGLVQVAGRKVGSVSEISLSPDGQADIELSLRDDSITPLHQGTRATVRALGQAGITNHFVDLAPGPSSAPEIPEGATLPAQQTVSMVALDALLDSFRPAQRANLRRLIANSADVFAGSGAKWFNSMLGELDPALREVNGMTADLVRDREAVRQVIRSGHRAAAAIDSRRGDLRAAVANTATALGAVARERRALGDLLDRAPAVLDQARGTLTGAGTALTALRPALRDVPAAAKPLGRFLQRSTIVLPRATNVVAELNRQLPGLRRSFDGLRPLRAPTVRALTSAAEALKVSRPIVRAARFYGSDFVIGILGGLVGAGAFNYSRWGHYERLDFIQPPQTSFSGFGLDPLPSSFPLIPGVFDIRTKLFRRCPGGNVPPAIDGSTPWVADESLCDPRQDMPAAVNDP